MLASVTYVHKDKLLDHTLELIRDIAWASKSRVEIKQFAVEILRDAGVWRGQNRQACALAIARWVNGNIQVVYDPLGTEILQTPQATIRLGFGDCDDIAILLASLLMSAGVEVQYRVIGQKSPEHIFVVANLDGLWVGFDPVASKSDPHPDSMTTFRVEGCVPQRGNRNALW